MPRPFSESERIAISRRLIAAAEGLFARRGIRATTVEQLAKAAGISKGAFYLFYPSKEALFFAVVENVETAMQARLEQQVADAPHDGLRLLLRASLQAREENPLFDVAISEEAVAVMRTMSPEEQEAFLRRDIEMTESIAAHLAAAGVTMTVSPEVLAGLLRAMVFVGLHRDDIGADMAPAIEDFLVESLAAALAGRASRPGRGNRAPRGRSPAMRNVAAIHTAGLRRRYGDVLAVDGLDLVVEPGEIYGFLGLNGAGKTTTIRMLLGMIRPSAGHASLLGTPVRRGGRGPWDRVGYLVDAPAPYPGLTVLENLRVGGAPARRLPTPPSRAPSSDWDSDRTRTAGRALSPRATARGSALPRRSSTSPTS